jgi:hypothetical protein
MRRRYQEERGRLSKRESTVSWLLLDKMSYPVMVTKKFKKLIVMSIPLLCRFTKGGAFTGYGRV